MSLTAGAKIGPYEIVALLGTGGMGEVYRGRDSRLNRDVALKVLLPNFAADADRMARFQREAQVLASLNHPHIAALYGLEEAGGVRALVMELVEGPTLAERIESGPMPAGEALAIAKQIADALEAAHDRGVIHRDLKPANVKLTPDGAVKVLDFGLAKALDDRPAPGSDPANSPTLTLGATTAGAILGTAAYMSPEQAKGMTVDRRADIWAFGVVLMEMLTGKRLYSGETAPETLAAVIMAAPSFDGLPGETPESVRKLIRRCLDKDPRRRLRDIGEARIALEESAAEAPAQPLRSDFSRRVLPWAMATAIAAICAVTLAFLYFRQTAQPPQVLRYSIQLPAKSLNSFAISPDGRYLAIAAEGEGSRQIWIRPLDTVTPRALRGTDAAVYPFWSPDSRSIGFFADGKLKRIAVEGGPAQILCDAPASRGGAWSRDGVIVFAGANTGPLQRVAATGGTPAQVTKLDPASSHRYPVFLSDGRRFLYTVSSGPLDRQGVYLASLDSETDRRVLADRSNVVWLPPAPGTRNGHILFTRDSMLLAQPFDAVTMQPAGDMSPAAEQVLAWGPNTNHAHVSISGNGVLVYLGSAIVEDSQLIWYDRGGKPLGTVGAPAANLDFALSPDERTVAVSRRAAGLAGNSDLWLHELARGVDTRLTFHTSRNLNPLWSPDGRRVVYTSNREGPNILYARDASGAGKEERLPIQGLDLRASDWSPDGKFLLYTECCPSTNVDLWVVPDPGVSQSNSKPVPFVQSPFTETHGQFSPDGHWVAYASDESGRLEVYVRPFPAGTGKWRISIDGGQLPRWRRDGKELFFLSPEQMLMATSVRAAPGAVPVFETSRPQALFHVRISESRSASRWSNSYAAGADGKRFLVNTSSGDTAETPFTVVVNWPAALKR